MLRARSSAVRTAWAETKTSRRNVPDEAQAVEERQGELARERGAAVAGQAAGAARREVAHAGEEAAGDEGLLAELDAGHVPVGAGGVEARGRELELVFDHVPGGDRGGHGGERVAEGEGAGDVVAVEGRGGAEAPAPSPTLGS